MALPPFRLSFGRGKNLIALLPRRDGVSLLPTALRRYATTGSTTTILSKSSCQRCSFQQSRYSRRNMLQMSHFRLFMSVADYHLAADETLERIQDAIDEALEEKGIPEYEVTLASGVLTLVLPPHGTWVINKQTPNQQLWWSSPISGPRRYEHDDGEWVFTRDESHSMTLFQALQEELGQIYGVELLLDS